MRTGLDSSMTAHKNRKDFPMFGTKVVFPFAKHLEINLTGTYINYFSYIFYPACKERYCMIAVDGYNDLLTVQLQPLHLWIDLSANGVKLKTQIEDFKKNHFYYLLYHINRKEFVYPLRIYDDSRVKVFSKDRQKIYWDCLPEFKIYEAFSRKEMRSYVNKQEEVLNLEKLN